MVPKPAAQWGSTGALTGEVRLIPQDRMGKLFSVAKPIERIAAAAAEPEQKRSTEDRWAPTGSTGPL